VRKVVIVLASTAWLLATASAAFSDELDDLFERASEAEFSGTTFVHCQTPEGVLSQITDIKQSGGVAIIKARTADTEVIARKGEYADRAGGYSKVAAVSVASSPDRSGHYQVEIAGVGRELGRRAVRLIADGILRVELRFDAATGAVLRSVSYNGDGNAYCTSEFIAFVPGSPDMDVATMENAERTELVVYPDHIDEGRLPAQAGSFTRADVYGGASGTLVAYYSDGVFSFTLVTAETPVEIPELSDIEPATIDGHEYQRLFFPGQAILVWGTAEGGYALVTDAPLDMQTAVLSDLPRPGKAFFLTRWWRALTGH